MNSSSRGAVSLRTLAPLMLAIVCAVVACSGTAEIDFEDTATGAGAAGATGGTAGGGAGTTSSAGGDNPVCDCDAAFSPVCGVDGQTHDVACGEECVPVAIACPGECPCVSCDDTATEYREALEAARQCDASTDIEQCTEQVTDGFPCGCPTFVNPGNSEAFAALQELAQKYRDMECNADIQCEACDEPPPGARCTPDSAGPVDACVDAEP